METRVLYSRQDISYFQIKNPAVSTSILYTFSDKLVSPGSHRVVVERAGIESAVFSKRYRTDQCSKFIVARLVFCLTIFSRLTIVLSVTARMCMIMLVDI